ncbi:MAG: glycosyltransferase [Agathobacter sp.]
MEECILSVYCLTYNHEKFIRKTLDGFINQVTKYKYEVIIHDDASTDGTPEIIKEYEEKYPNIIKAVYQKENQYSKGTRIYKNIIEPKLSGKYTAICEGDDYWCDEKKVELQVEYLETHPECSLCVHNTLLINETGESLQKYINQYKTDMDYSYSDVIEAGGSGLFHTSSFMYRTEDRRKMPSDDFAIEGIGDYPLAIYLSMIGKVHYIGRIMSCYRWGTVGGWTSRSKGNPELQLKHCDNVIMGLERMKQYSKVHYHEADFSFDKMITLYQFEKEVIQANILEIIKKAQYRKVFKENSLKQKVKILLKILLRKFGVKL